MRSRRFTVPLILGAAIVLLIAVFTVPGRTWTAAGAPPATGVEASDQDVLAKVKQAGLWEMPVGQWLAERGSTPDVRTVGQRISAEHHRLDQLTEDTAAALHVPLPAHPSVQQQGWMDDIAARTGPDFDARAVYLLRYAHGVVLPFLTQIRVGTRNPVIREFTTESMAYVQRHIQYLESTGLVRYEDLPHPADLGMDDWRLHAVTFVAFALLVAVLVIALQLARRALTGRGKTRTHPLRRPPEADHAPHRPNVSHIHGVSRPPRNVPDRRVGVGR